MHHAALRGHLALWLWLVSLASVARGALDPGEPTGEPTPRLPIPRFDSVDGAFRNRSLDEIMPFPETELLALEGAALGITRCDRAPNIVVFVSLCFSNDEIATLLHALDRALEASAAVAYYHDNVVSKLIVSQLLTARDGSCDRGGVQFPSDLTQFYRIETTSGYAIINIAKNRAATYTQIYTGFESVPHLDIRVCAALDCKVNPMDQLSATLEGVGAYAGQLRDIAKCGRLPGSKATLYTDAADMKQCQCVCPVNQEPVNGICKCTGGRELRDNQCQCTGGREFLDSQCQCTGGRVFLDNQCKCPPNQHLEGGSCVPDCFWKAGGEGFTCDWSNPAKTSLSLKDDCLVVAPVPDDNYVNDKRTNKNDAQLADPTITIEAQRRVPASTTKLTQKTTWLDYATAPGTLENQVTLDAFGVYDLSMIATDYRASATCAGCVAVVDNYGPEAVVKCQTSDSRSTNDAPLFSQTALAAAIAEERKFTSFYAPTNIRNNGAFDAASGANERTDVMSAKLQTFFSDSLSDLPSIDDECFTTDYVKTLLDASSARGGLAARVVGSPVQLVCKRCCAKARTLQENYFEYSCRGTGRPTKQTRTKDACSYGQCLSMPAGTLVTASVATTDASNNKTRKTLDGLKPAPAFVAKEIHRSFKCTAFAQGCSVTSRVGDLFARSTAWGVEAPTGYDVGSYVHWRYSVGTENWQAWNDDAVLTFSDPVTSVFVEAWTHCGRAYEDAFKVKLHPHTTRDVCRNFASRWVENAPATRVAGPHRCAYPDSDFFLLTFRYNSSENVDEDGTGLNVKGRYTNAACTVQLAESGALAAVAAAPIPLTISPDENGTFVLTKQIALELVRDPTTAQNTDVKVVCNFTFSHYDTQATYDDFDVCPYSFTITDCDRPNIQLKGAERVCAAGQCLLPSGAPGPFEACAGDVFVSVGGSSTALKPVSDACCADCQKRLACSAMPQSVVGGVKRCEPAASGGSFPVGETAMAMAMETDSVAEQAAAAAKAESPTATTLADAGVLVVALAVALVAVKVRASARVVDDAYVPLLD